MVNKIDKLRVVKPDGESISFFSKWNDFLNFFSTTNISINEKDREIKVKLSENEILSLFFSRFFDDCCAVSKHKISSSEVSSDEKLPEIIREELVNEIKNNNVTLSLPLKSGKIKRIQMNNETDFKEICEFLDWDYFYINLGHQYGWKTIELYNFIFDGVKCTVEFTFDIYDKLVSIVLYPEYIEKTNDNDIVQEVEMIKEKVLSWFGEPVEQYLNERKGGFMIMHKFNNVEVQTNSYLLPQETKPEWCGIRIIFSREDE